MSQMLFVGADVSAKTIEICVRPERLQPTCIANTPKGHASWMRKVRRPGRTVRVCLEATGLYGLDFALALDSEPGFEVMMLNPRASRRFSESLMERSKTDLRDADVLCTYAERMPFEAWHRPSPLALELRSLSRRLHQLVSQRTQEKNRLHAAKATQVGSALLVRDLEVHIRHLDRRITYLESKAVALLGVGTVERSSFDLLQTIPGIAVRSALLILGEILVLPADLNVRQWVAYAGLDPRTIRSGSSVRGPSGISKQGSVYLRSALYMPSQSVVRFDPAFEALYAHHLAKGKMKMVAIVAIMRKLLHVIYGVLRHRSAYDRSRVSSLEEVVEASCRVRSGSACKLTESSPKNFSFGRRPPVRPLGLPGPGRVAASAASEPLTREVQRATV